MQALICVDAEKCEQVTEPVESCAFERTVGKSLLRDTPLAQGKAQNPLHPVLLLQQFGTAAGSRGALRQLNEDIGPWR